MNRESLTPCLQNAQLHRILADAASSHGAAWTAHLDECANCQRRLEKLSGAVTWSHDSSLPNENLDPQQLSSLYELIVPGGGRNSKSDNPVTALLAPSSDANVMGNFDGYRVLKILGQGGMGVVFQAIEPLLDRVVAIKVLAPQLAASETARKRFLSEARAVAKIEHPHVVGIYQVSQHNGLPYIVMPCVDGESLEAVLRHQKTLPPERVIAIGIQACEALEAAHVAGIVHRDIKPGNLLIETATDNVKVTDFGLARAINDEALTQTGFITGTPQYMSPEQAQGKDVNHLSDLYSLAAVMYTMLAGRPPFAAADPLATIHQVVYNDPPVLSTEANDRIPPWLITLVDRTLSKRPEDRPQSTAALKRCLVDQGTSSLSVVQGHDQQQLTHQPSTTFGSARQVLSLLACVLLLAGIWFGTQWLTQTNSDRADSPVDERLPACMLTLADGTTLDCDSLNDAMAAVQPGCVIQLNTAGPHVLQVPVADHSFEIRGAADSADERPVLAINGMWTISGEVMLSNVDIRRKAGDSSGAATESHSHELITVHHGKLTLHNCRVTHDGICLTVQSGSECVVEDSLLASCGASHTIDFAAHRETRLTILNSVVTGESTFMLTPDRSSLGGELTLRDSTIYADNVMIWNSAGPRGPRVVPLKIEARGNVFQSHFLQVVDGMEMSNIPVLESRSQQQLKDHIRWRGDGNLFSLSEGFTGFYLPRRGFVAGRTGFRDLAGWKAFCAAEGESSVEATTGVLSVVKSPGELEGSRIVPSTFALSKDQSAKKFGVDVAPNP